MAKKLRRRLAGERAAVMLEFAFVAPLVVMTVAFAADFTRILRTEQQLEIATRLAADVEAHMANYYGKDPCPSSAAKRVAKFYLADVAEVVESTDDVYIKGSCRVIKNPVSYAVDKVRAFLDGSMFQDSNVFLKLVGKILGGLMNFIDLEGGAAATAWNLKVNPAKRHRVYCHMPVVDSVPIAPQTYVRKFKAWCAKQPFLKGLVK